MCDSKEPNDRFEDFDGGTLQIVLLVHSLNDIENRGSEVCALH